MPGVHGLALARTLIDLGIPIMIMSGEPALQRQLAEAGCRFLPKPFRLVEISVEMRILLDNATRRAMDLRASFERFLEAQPEYAHVIEQSRQLSEESGLAEPV